MTLDTTDVSRNVHRRNSAPLPLTIAEIDDIRRSHGLSSDLMDHCIVFRHPPMAVAAARRRSCSTVGTYIPIVIRGTAARANATLHENGRVEISAFSPGAPNAIRLT